MQLSTKLFGTSYQFRDVKDVLAKANEEKSGDTLAGVGAQSIAERVAAKAVLSQMTLEDLYQNPVIPYEQDEVTRIIIDDVNVTIFVEIKNWTVEHLREYILDLEVTGAEIRRISRGLTSEMVAAVAKLMSNLDLIQAAQKLRVTAHCRTTIGEEGRLATRLQPNHPTDDVNGMLASLREGLSYGIGDAVIGINPVEDNPVGTKRLLDALEDYVQKYEIPAQTCVLSHVTTQMKAIENGAHTGLIFQSIAGTEAANTSFGIDGKMIQEARDLMLKKGMNEGPNVNYFETGQGSELSSEAHGGADQVTLEARCYGFAKRYQPYIVNTVVGFIGPEYLYDSKQVIRAGLEDHFMGKLTGIPMGCDVCYTNHMKADQNDIENLGVLLTMAGCNYFMGVPMGDDIMLNYQCSSYHDDASLREITHTRPLAEFEAWLEKQGFMENGRLTKKAGDASAIM
ncbi:MAG TPA: ethanolamine ammonia-lyase subunit EutB [Clostridiales bacterium]|nr:ethanolamine ammonia-lyase subunit EutB [Clostridiales bacterium]